MFPRFAANGPCESGQQVEARSVDPSSWNLGLLKMELSSGKGDITAKTSDLAYGWAHLESARFPRKPKDVHALPFWLFIIFN
jgi:hypothetical protein